VAGTACIGTFAPTPASKDGRASLGGHKFGLVATRKVKPETQTGIRERCLYIRLGQTYPLPKDRKFEIVFPMLL